MQIRPILSSLRKHKIPSILIVLEIALACAVLCNAVFMISQRVGEMHMSNAVDENGMVDFDMQGTNPELAAVEIPRHLAALRALPNVIAAAAFNTVPLSNTGWNGTVSTKPGEVTDFSNPNVALYLFTRGGDKALGLQLLKGRFFQPTDYGTAGTGKTFMGTGPVVLITQSLADRLWHGQNVLGKMIWIGKQYHFTVVGVLADVLRSNQNGQGAAGFHWAIFFPASPQAFMSDYLVRTTAQQRGQVIGDGLRQLQALSPSAVISGKTFSEIRETYFAHSRSMVWMLVLVCVVMLAVTAFGIVGLTSFWVGQRRRQIGIRRAVGARRMHILHYFQTENFLLSTVGVVLGMILAFGINLYLLQHFSLNRMPWFYLPASAVVLWLLGQLAVLGPALRASRVPPVVATRSV